MESSSKANGTLKLEIPGRLDDAEQSEEEEIAPDTPRVDKGKGRAKPEPEVFEKVLSPSFMITSSDDDEDEGKAGPDEAVDGPSPLDLCVLLSDELICKSELF